MPGIHYIWVLLVALAMTAGCPGAVPEDGGSVGDGGPPDGGVEEPSDAGAVDDDGGSSPDAGGIDGDGGPADSGLEQPDAGVGDALCAEGVTGPGEYEHQVHHFVGDDGVEVWLTRDYEGQGAGFTSVWSTPRVSVVQDDVDVCVTDPARLTYTWTHHNWNDSAEVEVAENLRFVFVVVPGRGAVAFENLLTRVDDEGTVLAGPFSLVHQEGSSWP